VPIESLTMSSQECQECSIDITYDSEGETHEGDTKDDRKTSSSTIWLQPSGRDLRTNSWTGGHIDKKMLSPIAERRASLHSQSMSELGHLRAKYSTNEPPEVHSDEEDGGGAEKKSSYIARMMRDLFIHKTPDENIFHAIDPLELERRINSSIALGGYQDDIKRTRSEHTSSMLGSIKNAFSPFVSRIKTSSSSPKIQISGHYGSKERSLSDDFDRTSTQGLPDTGADDVWNDVCYAPRFDKGSRLDYRRRSSPEGLQMYDHFKSLVNKEQTKEKKVTHKNDKRKFGLTHSSSKDKGLTSPWQSRKGTPKLSRENSLVSPLSSEKGTPKISPKLSRQSSLQSPVGSKKGKFTFESPFSSRRGTPKLSRESSTTSPLLLSKEGNTPLKRGGSLNSFCFKIGLKFDTDSSAASSPVTKARPLMPKVTSMPLLITKRSAKPEQEKGTPKQKRANTPKLSRRKCKSVEYGRNFALDDDSDGLLKSSKISRSANNSRKYSERRKAQKPGQSGDRDSLTRRKVSADRKTRREAVEVGGRGRIASDGNDNVESCGDRKNMFTRSISESAVVEPGGGLLRGHLERRRSRRDLFETSKEDHRKKVERWLSQVAFFVGIINSNDWCLYFFINYYYIRV